MQKIKSRKSPGAYRKMNEALEAGGEKMAETLLKIFIAACHQEKLLTY